MIAGKRHIKDGNAFNGFFPKATGKDVVVKKKALLADTIDLMKRVIDQTKWQTEKIAKHLDTGSVRKTCKRIWEFCYQYIQYEKDEERTEQIRTPRRAWHDRESGIDCDCFTVLIGSILSNLNIPFTMRLWRNQSENFEHVYPVVHTPKGQEIIIDCVIDQFDEQAPYTEIKDIEMELQVLDGVDQERYNEFGDKIFFETDLPIDAEDLNLGEDALDLEGVDGFRDFLKRQKEKRTQRKTERKEKRAIKKQTPLKERVREKVRNFGQKLNKVNPVVALLRAGVLASMKLNIMQVASKLRFAYWTPQEARRRNMNMAKYSQVMALRTKIEKIYRNFGGNVKSLRKSILTGKGNLNKMVSLNGLGAVTIPSEEDTLISVLGDDIVANELYESGILDEGINGLGSVSLSAAIAAAAGFIAKISGMFKKIGGFFNKGSKEDSQFQIQQNTEAQQEKTSRFSIENIRRLVNQRRNNQPDIENGRPTIQQQGQSAALISDEDFSQGGDFGTGSDFSQSGDAFSDDFGSGGSSAREPSENLPETNEDSTEFETPKENQPDGSNSKNDDKEPTVWYKNPWVYGGAAAVIGLGVVGYFIFRPKPSSPVNGIDGVSKAKKTSKTKRKSPKPKRKKKTTKSRASQVRRVELQP
ncbi:MAG: hypothetical protein Crog4KO_25930 [Crocinitomicaceae bacterium]